MESRTKYLYRSPLADKVILLSLVGYPWLGTIFDWESFPNSFNARLLTSSAMLYLTWHFFASRKILFIEITDDGIKIPDIWLPGLLTHKFTWESIRDIESSWEVGSSLATIRIRSYRRFPFYIYKKCIRIHNLNMISSSDASNKLLQELRTHLQASRKR